MLGADERAELRTVEMQIEMARRLFPADFEREAEEKYIRDIAKIVKVPIEVKVLPEIEVLRHDDGFPSPLTMHRMEISGRAGLQAIEMFLEFLGKRDWRAGDLERLRLERDGDLFRFTARMALPTFGYVEVLPGLARLKENLSLLMKYAKPERLRAAVSALADVPEDEGVHVTRVEVDEAFSMQGVVLGSRARSNLVSAFEEIAIAPGDGPCRSFAWPAKELDPRLTALCAEIPRKHLGTVAVRGKGTLTVRLRDVDVGGAFFVLHDLTGESFVIDTNVTGLVNVSVENASIDETLRAMRGVGLAVSAGPLRRVSVSAGGRAATPADKYTGEPMSFSFQDASMRSILCLFSQISGLEILAPAAFRGRTTLYASELPWDRVMTDLIYSAGLRYAIEGTKVYVGDERPGLNVCGDVEEESLGSPFATLRMPLASSAASDLKLAGVAKVGDEWKAYAYVPWRWIAEIGVGQELLDSFVRAVGEKGFEIANAR